MKVGFLGFLPEGVCLVTDVPCAIAVGECKHIMTSYLSCMKKVGGVNQAECRSLAKSYLGCRMDR